MKLIFSGLFMLLFIKIYACDACANFSNGVNLGIMPLLSNNIISTSYTLSKFKTLPFAYSKNTNKEITQSFDLQSRFKIIDRFHLMTALPINYFQQKGDFINANLIGLGDLTIIGSYLAIDKRSDESKGNAHLLFFNLGLKLPTGVKDIVDETGKLYNPRMQPGTGSVDYVIGANYILKHKKNSFQLDLNGKLNTMNKALYKMGDQYKGTLRYSRWFSLGEGDLLLSTAYIYTNIRDDYSKNDLFHGTHGRVEHHAQIGVDLFLKKFIVSFSYQNPLLKDDQMNEIKLINTFNATIGYRF